MKNLNKRLVNAGGLFACVGMMAYALYAEHKLFLMPCPLCSFQRLAVIGLGLVFLLALIHGPRGWGGKVYAGLVLLTAGFGTAIAGWHVWIQNLPSDEVPSCGPGLDYMVENFPFTEVLSMVFTGSGECATIDWQFLGLSMPAWVLICVSLLGIIGIWNNARSTRVSGF